MDTKTARDILSTCTESRPSEVAEAVDVLYREFGTYQAIAGQVGRSDKFWGTRHRIFRLPAGIQWKIDEGQIGIEQGYQISRLESEEDQWLLAVAIIEAKDLTGKECASVVSLVLKEDKSIREALSLSAGVRFDRTHPLLLPLPFDIWLAMCKRAWARCQNWQDLTYQLILQSLDFDPEDVACQFEDAASQLLKHAEDLRKTNRNKLESGTTSTQESEDKPIEELQTEIQM